MSAETGTITVCKLDYSDPLNPVPLEGWNFSLLHEINPQVDGQTDSQGKVVFDNLAAGEYTLIEDLEVGWHFVESVELDNTDQPIGGSENDDNTRAITLEEGEDKTFLFRNVKRGDIIVMKKVLSSSCSPCDNEFCFEINIDEDFDDNDDTFILKNGQTKLFQNLIPTLYSQVYTIREKDLPTGWLLHNIECISQLNKSSCQIVDDTANVTLYPGDTVKVVFEDTTKPIINCPCDIEIDHCGKTEPKFTGEARAFNPCFPDRGLDVTYEDEIVGDCLKDRTITRTWKAVDPKLGLETEECVQIIIVKDTTPPTICCPPDIELECDQSYKNPKVTGEPEVSDRCEKNPKVTFSDEVICGKVPQIKIVKRTWTVTDSCGQSSSCVQTIKLLDSEAPVITPPKNITVDKCTPTNPARTGRATAVDKCDPNPKITFCDVVEPGKCCKVKRLIRTWKATDCSGNSSTAEQIIRIVDRTPPKIICPPDTCVQSCELLDPMFSGEPCIKDICEEGNSHTVRFEDRIVHGECEGDFHVKRKWIVKDCVKNIAKCVQTIEVINPDPPCIIAPPDICIDSTESINPCSTGRVIIKKKCTYRKIYYCDAIHPSDEHTAKVVRTWIGENTKSKRFNSCRQKIYVIKDYNKMDIDNDYNEGVDKKSRYQPIIKNKEHNKLDAGHYVEYNESHESNDNNHKIVVVPDYKRKDYKYRIVTNRPSNSKSNIHLHNHQGRNLHLHQSLVVNVENKEKIHLSKKPCCVCDIDNIIYPPNIILDLCDPVDPKYTGKPVVKHSKNTIVKMWHFDHVNPGNECYAVLKRTWITEYVCGKSVEYTQLINITNKPCIDKYYYKCLKCNKFHKENELCSKRRY